MTATQRQPPAEPQNRENGAPKRALAPEVRAVVVRALVAAIVAEMRGES